MAELHAPRGYQCSLLPVPTPHRHPKGLSSTEGTSTRKTKLSIFSVPTELLAFRCWRVPCVQSGGVAGAPRVDVVDVELLGAHVLVMAFCPSGYGVGMMQPKAMVRVFDPQCRQPSWKLW